jgi:hypothetical protein
MHRFLPLPLRTWAWLPGLGLLLLIPSGRMLPYLPGWGGLASLVNSWSGLASALTGAPELAYDLLLDLPWLGLPLFLLLLLPVFVLLKLFGRRRGLLLLGYGLLVALAARPARSAMEAVRPHSLRHSISQAQPVLQALARYHRQHGRYPDSLSALVPAFLPSIPSPGTFGARGFLYVPTTGQLAFYYPAAEYFSSWTWTVYYSCSSSAPTDADRTTGIPGWYIARLESYPRPPNAFGDGPYVPTCAGAAPANSVP